MKLRRLFAHENAGFLRCELTQAQAAGRHVLGVSRGWEAPMAARGKTFGAPKRFFRLIPAQKRSSEDYRAD